MKSVIPALCSRLGKYRQPFCWGMIPLFNEDLSGLAGGEGSEFKPLYRQKPTDISDSHFLELINEYTKVLSAMISSVHMHRLVPAREIRPFLALALLIW